MYGLYSNYAMSVRAITMVSVFTQARTVGYVH